MKIIKKSRLTNGQANNLNDPEKIMNEILIMKALRHVSTKIVNNGFYFSSVTVH